MLAATAIGALVGGMLPDLVTKRDEGEDYNGDPIAGAMTAGLWAAPDPKYGNPGSTTTAKHTPVTSYVPFIGDHRQVGLMAGGTW